MRSKREWSQQSGQVTIKREGKTYTGTWILEAGVIATRALGEERRTHHTAGMPPEPIARMLLLEIVKERGIRQGEAPA